MIKVFAVEPALFREWSDFKYLSPKFGFSKRRLISAFPSKWARMVLETAKNFSPMQRKSLELWFQNKKDTFLVKSGCNYDPTKDWLLNVENIDTQDSQHFHVILACENPRQYPKIIIAQDEIIDEHPLFKCPYGCIIKQIPQNYAAVSYTLLKYAKRVIVIDPYIGTDAKWTDTFIALLSCIRSQNQTNFSILIFYDTSVSGFASYKSNIANKYQRLKAKVPTDCTLEIVFIEKDNDKEHNRYVLTESGGIMFPWGLDSLGSDKEDTISTLDLDVHKKLYHDYETLTGRKILGKIVM